MVAACLLANFGGHFGEWRISRGAQEAAETAPQDGLSGLQIARVRYYAALRWAEVAKRGRKSGQEQEDPRLSLGSIPK